MKRFPNSLILISIFLFFLSSCESKIQELRSKSPDGTLEVIVKGNKTGIDPWKLDILQVKNGKPSSTIGSVAEFHAGDLTNENIIFKWAENQTCMIKLIEQDGVAREISVQF
jgi:hypothetical protein